MFQSNKDYEISYVRRETEINFSDIKLTNTFRLLKKT